MLKRDFINKKNIVIGSCINPNDIVENITGRIIDFIKDK